MHPSPYHLAELPAGPAATAETIAVVARLAAGVYGAQNPQVRDIAVRIVAGIPSRDYRGEAAAVLRWVREHCRYRRDPVGLERVAVPLTTIADQAGDCDDLAL